MNRVRVLFIVLVSCGAVGWITHKILSHDFSLRLLALETASANLKAQLAVQTQALKKANQKLEDCWNIKTGAKDKASEFAPPKVESKQETKSLKDEISLFRSNGKTVSLELKEAPISEVLKLIAWQGDINIVIAPSIDQRIDVHFQDAPLYSAFDQLFDQYNLEAFFERGVLSIVDRDELGGKLDQAIEEEIATAQYIESLAMKSEKDLEFGHSDYSDSTVRYDGYYGAADFYRFCPEGFVAVVHDRHLPSGLQPRFQPINDPDATVFSYKTRSANFKLSQLGRVIRGRFTKWGMVFVNTVRYQSPEFRVAWAKFEKDKIPVTSVCNETTAIFQADPLLKSDHESPERVLERAYEVILSAEDVPFFPVERWVGCTERREALRDCAKAGEYRVLNAGRRYDRGGMGLHASIRIPLNCEVEGKKWDLVAELKEIAGSWFIEDFFCDPKMVDLLMY